MNDLIEALNILNKYINPAEKWPTWCEPRIFVTIYERGKNEQRGIS